MKKTRFALLGVMALTAGLGSIRQAWAQG